MANKGSDLEKKNQCTDLGKSKYEREKSIFKIISVDNKIVRQEIAKRNDFLII